MSRARIPRRVKALVEHPRRRFVRRWGLVRRWLLRASRLVQAQDDPDDPDDPDEPPSSCQEYRPDHNGECLHCDEWADEHTPEAIAAGERRLAHPYHDHQEEEQE